MSRATRQKLPAAEHYICQSREQTAEAIAEIGQRQRERDRVQAAMNDELAAIRADYEAQAKPHAERIAELTRAINGWCEAHRAELTQSGKVKTHLFATGEVRWRLRPPSIVVRGAEAVIGTLQKLGLGRFLRTKVEIDKEALLKEPDVAKQVGGISLTQKEDFVIVPAETQLEEVQS